MVIKVTIFKFHFQRPVAWHGEAPSEGKEKDEVKIALETLDGKLTGRKYLSGDVLTLADASAICNFVWMDIFPEFDLSTYPNVRRWSEAIRQIPEFKKAHEGFDKFVKSKLGKN